MVEDVFKLAEALDTGFLDVQADAATAVAGLTSVGEAISPTTMTLSIAYNSRHNDIYLVHRLHSKCVLSYAGAFNMPTSYK